MNESRTLWVQSFKRQTKLNLNNGKAAKWLAQKFDGGGDGFLQSTWKCTTEKQFYRFPPEIML